MANVGFEENANSGLWDDMCCPGPANLVSGYSTNKPVLSLSSGPPEPQQYYDQQPQQQQSLRYSENSLRVALPPEDSAAGPGYSRRSVSPGNDSKHLNVRDTLQQPQPQAHSSYGSILELEASPRRYRNSDLKDLLYSAMGSQDSPTAYSDRYSSSRETRASSVDSSLNIPMPLDPPPALPERPPKVNHLQSPPPLPPKKVQQQAVLVSGVARQQQQTWSSKSGNGGSPIASSNDIYDFIPEPGGIAAAAIGGSMTAKEARNCIYEILDDKPTFAAASQAPVQSTVVSDEPPQQNVELTVGDLVRMNVLELSKLLTEGCLPSHLSGMSLFELVDYIGKLNAAQNDLPLFPQQHSPDSLLDNNYRTQAEQEILRSSISRKNSILYTNQNMSKSPIQHQFQLSLQPSFSDNFDLGQQPQQQAQAPATVTSNINCHSSRQRVTHLFENTADVHGLTISEVDQLDGSFNKEQYGSLGSQLTPHSTGSLSAHGNAGFSISSPLSNASSSRYNMSEQMPGFDDDFAQLSQPAAIKCVASKTVSHTSTWSTSSSSGTTAPTLPASAGEVYDKYAVFRELQFEEELVNAWKSPTEEEKGNEDFIAEHQEADPVDEDNIGEQGEGNQVSDPEENDQEENTSENNHEIEECKELESRSKHYQETSQASCEFSPSNRLLHCRSGSTLDSEDEMNYRNNDAGTHFDGVSLGCNQSNSSINHPAPASPQDLSRFHGSDVAQNNSQLDWAKFDESGDCGGEDVGEQNFEFSAFLSQEEQANILGVSHRNNNSTQVDQYQEVGSTFTPENHSRGLKENVANLTLADPFHDSLSHVNDGSNQSSKNSTKDLPNTNRTSPVCSQYQSFVQLDQDEVEDTDVDKKERYMASEQQEDSQQLVTDKDPFESDWEPAFYQRDRANGIDEVVQRDAWDLSFQREEVELCQRLGEVADVVGDTHGMTINIEEAFPTDDKYRHLGSTSRASADSLFAANPFNDNFVPNNGNVQSGAGASSATPPLFLYDGDRLSNASDISYQSSEVHEGEDIFAKESGFSDLTFRIEAKTKLCKSDSINIFSVSEDPFDDDFFK